MEATTGGGAEADLLARVALKEGELGVGDSEGSGNGWDDRPSVKGNELRI